MSHHRGLKDFEFQIGFTLGCGTVSHHRGLKDFEFQIGFMLRMWNCVSSLWFERHQISDRLHVKDVELCLILVV